VFLDLGWEGRDVGVRRVVWWNWQLSATRASTKRVVLAVISTSASGKCSPGARWCATSPAVRMSGAPGLGTHGAEERESGGCLPCRGLW